MELMSSPRWRSRQLSSAPRADDVNRILISTTNGLTWQEVWKSEKTGHVPAAVSLVGDVNGAYEVLVQFELLGKKNAADAGLDNVEIETTTKLNAKTQPRLNLGKNAVYVGLGDQSGSIVLWPDLQGENARPMIVEQKNMVFKPSHPGYMGTMYAKKAE